MKLSPGHEARVLGAVRTLVWQGNGSGATIPVRLISWIAKQLDKIAQNALGIGKADSLGIAEETWPGPAQHQHSGTRWGLLSEGRGNSQSKLGTTLGRLYKDKIAPKWKEHVPTA